MSPGRKLGSIGILTCLLGAATPRKQSDVHGDFILLGNTLARDCNAPAANVLSGTVGACGTNTGDTSVDVFWRSDDPSDGDAYADTSVTLAQSRSTAMLVLPPNATVIYARLYWAAIIPGCASVADTSVTLHHPTAGDVSVTADDSKTGCKDSGLWYQSTADVTALVSLHGAGPYRVSDVTMMPIADVDDSNPFDAWAMVVFYQRDGEPLRNLTLFDGTDLTTNASPIITSGNDATAAIAGFTVPATGFQAKLGVIAYEGDVGISGDRLQFQGQNAAAFVDLWDATNPADNFFNGSRAQLGAPMFNAGDAPKLSGGAGSLTGVDLDVVDLTASRYSPRLLASGDTQATVRATSTGDGYMLGALVTSISTLEPRFDGLVKTARDVNGGALRPGDVLEYTITLTNTGTDAAVLTVLTDTLPAGLQYVPASTFITAGPNAQMPALTDATGDDAVDCDGTIITARLGLGADGALGGTIEVGESATVVFSAIVVAAAGVTLVNQAGLAASGENGAPRTSWLTDGDGAQAGSQGTTTPIDGCETNNDCTGTALPYCLVTATPKRCVGCLTSAACGGTTPVCDPGTLVCTRCAADNQCPDGATPACQPSGACGACSATLSSCVAPTPACDVGVGACVPCVGNSDCSGALPACDATAHVCVGCNDDSGCSSTAPICDATTRTCVVCTDTRGCSGATPVCDVEARLCVACMSDGDCDAGETCAGGTCGAGDGVFAGAAENNAGIDSTIAHRFVARGGLAGCQCSSEASDQEGALAIAALLFFALRRRRRPTRNV